MKKPVLAAIMSALIWGSGQLYNKQRIKGLVFFLVQVALIAAEILTATYPFGIGGHFRDAGFFTSGFWGAITLGTQLGQLTMDGMTPGDHSVMLLIQGIIAFLILMMFVVFWVVNIKDAYQTAKEINETGNAISTKAWVKRTWEQSFAYIVLTPAMIMLIMFILMPLVFSFVVAFTNYNSHNLPPANLVDWVGINNFRFLFSVGEVGGGARWLHTFIQVFWWTVIFAIISTIVPFFLGLFQAVILNNKRVKFRKMWRSILILPWAMPAMISQLNFQQIFNGSFGPLNRWLQEVGILNEPILWLSHPHNPWLIRSTILFIGFWLAFPYWMALMSGVMTSISKDVYEAAEIDGATERQQFRRITLPLVLAATAPLLVMSFATNFNNFGLIYFLTSGGPSNPAFVHAGHTDILISWIFSLTIDYRMYNMAAVMSIIIFLIIGSISTWNFMRTSAFKEDR